MYLMRSVAGHLTILLSRTRGPFWSIRPARILWIAVLGTQIIATLIAVNGLFMHPLGWGLAGFVWAYVIIWALVSDRIKLLAYRILDPAPAPARLTWPRQHAVGSVPDRRPKAPVLASSVRCLDAIRAAGLRVCATIVNAATLLPFERARLVASRPALTWEESLRGNTVMSHNRRGWASF